MIMAKQKVKYSENWKEYWSFVGKHKWIAFLLIALTLIHETKQVVERYLFKVVIDNGTSYEAGVLQINSFQNILLIVAIIFLLGILSSVVINWVRIHFINRLEANAIFDMKHKYFSHIISLDYSFHTTHKTGSLISRLSRSAGAIERLSDTIIFDLSPLTLQWLIAIISFIYLDARSAIILTITMIVFITFSIIMQKKSEPSNILANETEDFEKGNMADFFTNIDSIRYFGKEDYVRSKYKKLTTKTRQNALSNWDFWRFTTAGQSLILGIGTFFLLFFSIKSFINGEVSIGTLAFIYTTYLGIMGPLFGFVHGIRNVSRSMADFQELFEYGKVQKEVKDLPDSKVLKIEHGDINFENITFKYGKRGIFKNFDLKIPRHKKFALVGHSGSGKSTLVKLLYRLYDLERGEVLIDGKDIKDFKQDSLRSEMAIVPQECVLFDDTIYNNIAFSKEDATHEEVMNAIKFAQLDKIIKSFPLKEKTIVGERGVKLSGGEKQRVSIARAILADKKILILDEATSSLDSETEHEIQLDLQRLMEGRTSIIIAHRLSTIMHADEIIVLKDGQIVQKGTHRQLINQQGEYKKLWNLQKGGYIGE